MSTGGNQQLWLVPKIYTGFRAFLEIPVIGELKKWNGGQLVMMYFVVDCQYGRVRCRRIWGNLSDLYSFMRYKHTHPPPLLYSNHANYYGLDISPRRKRKKEKKK